MTVAVERGANLFLVEVVALPGNPGLGFHQLIAWHWMAIAALLGAVAAKGRVPAMGVSVPHQSEHRAGKQCGGRKDCDEALGHGMATAAGQKFAPYALFVGQLPPVKSVTM